MNRFCALAAIFFFLNGAGCSNPVEPIKTQELKDPRGYTWTIDTLLFTPNPQLPGQTIIQDFWGLNDTLLYAVCHDFWGGSGAMWRYDGKQWKPVELNLNLNGALNQSYWLRAIKGFSENDIYVFGYYKYPDKNPPYKNTDQALVAHYNGSVWRQITIPSGKTISNVDHDSPSMIFCGGPNGQLYQFDGSRWMVDTVKILSQSNISSYVTVVGMNADNGVLIQTTQYDTTAVHAYYQFSNYKDKQITPIGSSVDHPDWGGESFWKSKEGNIYSCGWNGVWRLTGTKWTQAKESFQYVNSIYGIDEKHMFAAERTNLFYYDGSIWTQLNTKFSITFMGAKIWCTSREVFVAFTDGIKTYILHGK